MSQVVIIGAGPAGSTAAMLLARAGIGVALIEQHRFPRDKVCGECLSALGIDVLNRLTSASPVESRLTAPAQSLNAIPLTRTLLFSSDGARTEITLPRPMWGISRNAFDDFLLSAAREAGAKVIQPARSEAIGPPTIVRHLDTNRIEQIEADWVLVADGKGQATGDFGLKAHFVGIDAPHDAIELFGVQGHYGGVAPIEGDRWNIAFSVPELRIRESGGDLDTLFVRIAGENVELSRQMRRARRVSDWMASPLPRFGVKSDWPPRVIPIGNAAAAVEPIGGEGMGLAMRSAELAAEFIIRAAQPKCHPERTREGSRSTGIEIPREYARDDSFVDVTQLQDQYRRLWTMPRLACRAAALLVSSPKLACAFAGFVQDDNLTALALRLVGKASPAREA